MPEGTFDLDDVDFAPARVKKPRPKPKFDTATPARRRMVVDWYYRVQRLRIGISNAIKGLRRDYPKAYSEVDAERDRETYLDPIKAQEEAFAAACKTVVENEPLANWMVDTCKGLGWNFAAQLMGLIGNIGLFPTVSKLWAYAGYKPDDRRVAGEKAGHSPALKRLIYNVATSFLKAGGYYGQIYAHYRSHEEKRYEDFVSRLLERLRVSEQRRATEVRLKIEAELTAAEEHRRLMRAWEARSEAAEARVDELVEAEANAEAIEAAKRELKAVEKEKPNPFSWVKFLRAVFEAAVVLGFKAPPKITEENRFAAFKAATRHLSEIMKITGVAALTPNHRHLRSLRKVGKLFLQHLWLKWRELEGLPISDPWVFGPGGHDKTHYIPAPADRDAQFPPAAARGKSAVA